MLLKRVIKPIFKNKANGISTINLPKEFADKCNGKIIFDIYEDKVVIKTMEQALKEE